MRASRKLRLLLGAAAGASLYYLPRSFRDSILSVFKHVICAVQARASRKPRLLLSAAVGASLYYLPHSYDVPAVSRALDM